MFRKILPYSSEDVIKSRNESRDDDEEEDDADRDEEEAVEAQSGLTGTTTGDSVLQFSQLQQKYFH